jgi:hypothetical protein
MIERNEINEKKLEKTGCDMTQDAYLECSQQGEHVQTKALGV